MLRDAAGEKLHEEWEEAKADFKEKHLHMSALQLMKTGDVSGAVGKDEGTDNRGMFTVAGHCLPLFVHRFVCCLCKQADM